MKKRTIYTLPKDTEITGEVLASLIKLHKADRATFTILESYVDDEPQIQREAPNALLTIHNFAQYITSINTGYLLGHAVDYNSSGNIDAVVDNYRNQSISDLDTDLGTDCSMFGQAFENTFMDETSTATSAKLSVHNTIVVYDNTFKHNKMFAVYYAPEMENGRASSDKFDLTIWTDTHILHRKLDGDTLTETDEPDTEHFFGEVPVVHYINNKRMKGDFEPVISLIDAYNILQSDRVIDREKLVDAILAFHGARLTEEEQKAIKENRVIGLPEGSKAEYIIKQLDELGADVLRKNIAADIHKFSMTPDLTDEAFGNSPSGVSILYKLLAFEQNIKNKEVQFERGLKTRFRLYANILSTSSKVGKIDVGGVDAVFRRALPKNDFETSQMINNLDGIVDQESLIGQLSFIEDASAAVEKARKENTLTPENYATDNFVKA